MATLPTPNMNLPVPIVGQEVGPQWAIDINACFSLLDSHDHTPGSGVQITPSALSINADLSFQSNNATLVRTVRFDPQVSVPSQPTDIGTLEVVDVDLWYNDVNGNQIRLTQSGSIVGTAGSISGLVPPASASYNAISSKFVWQANANVAASMDFASAILRKNGVVSSPGLTLQVPTAMASDFTLVLPVIPVSKKIVTIDTSGNINADYDTDNSTLEVSSNNLRVKAAGITSNELANDSVTTPAILNGTVTIPKLGPANLTNSLSSGSFVTSSPTFVDVPLLLNTIAVNGRPRVIMLNSASSSLPGFIGATSCEVIIVRDSGVIAYFRFAGGSLPCSAISFVDFANGGVSTTYTYKIQVRSLSGAMSVNDCSLLVYEMG